jgi:putative holliday junction resolvase
MLCAALPEFEKALLPSRRILGLDVGDTTIGIAVSDTRLTIASPLLTIARKKFAADLAQLNQAIAEHEACGLILGLPLQMDGKMGPRAQSVRQFAFNTAKAIEIPILLWDERFSTAAVKRTIDEADLNRNRRDALVDKLAASFILQGFLDMLQGKKV